MTVFFTPSIEANEPPTTGGMKFILTHMNGRALERNAYFWVTDTNPLVLDLRDGNSTFKFYISGSLDSMCGLFGKDQYGKAISLCLTQTNGANMELEIKYTNKILRFTGYYGG